MSNLVLSNSLSMSLQTSQKEMSMSPITNSPVLVGDSLLLSRYIATIHYLEEKKNEDNSKTPALYHHKNGINDGSALEEEEDTESEEDDDEDLLSSSETAAFSGGAETAKGKTPPPPPAAIDVSSTSYFTPLTSSISNAPPTIQTYLPQLNLNLYSPCSTPVSSIRSSSISSISSKKDRGYNAAKPPSSCFRDTWNTVQNPTNNISSPLKQQKPLYPSSSSIASTIKMDIRSPPQPSQSTSRFMNAFQRFKSSSLSQHSRNHQMTNNNSVAPAEIIQSMKPSPSKSSLADKIKTKFQQLDKKKRSGFVNDSPPSRKSSKNEKSKKPAIPNSSSAFSMPRSASISSITNWSSRLTNSKSTTTVNNRLSHSTSMTSFLSSKRNSTPLKPTASLLSSSSSSSSLSEDEDSEPSTPTRRFSPKPSQNGPLSLTKSISSHRLYKSHDNRSSSSSGHSNHSNSSTTSSHSRPRQPLRAVNPNESVRLSRQLLQQQQQQKKKTSVRFNKVVAVKETYSKSDYDRGSDPEAVCTRLTPAMAQHIKEELNAFKLHEMQVHEFSRVHTHFFL